MKEDASVVIKQADKGGAVVIWPRDMYVTEGKRQVSNTEWYRKIKEDPTKLNQEEIAAILK